MGETFYTVLGVRRDADQDAIRSAYREQVKESHPDVSDSPDATRRFKRLTTAREVLVDTDERRRYDRLGHDTYVRRHVETSAWGATETDRSGTTANRSTTDGTSVDSTGGDDTSDRHAAGRRRRQPTGREAQHRQGAHRGNGQRASRQVSNSATPDGGYGASWQQAPDAYMRSETFGESATPGRTFGESLRTLGPWLFVHAVLLTSAVGTGSFVLARALSDPAISLGVALFLIVMLSLVVVISILHLVTEAYA